MQKQFIHVNWLVQLAILIPFIVACNAYRPFATEGSDEYRLEEAERCLQNSDFSCAISQYNALTDASVKNEKLCLVYLTKGGVGITTLINTINQNSATVLGAFARTLLPWSSTKSADLDDAKTHCANFAAQTGSGDQGTLLKAVSLFAHCSIRMAKTDQFVATSESDTACTTAGNSSGTLTQSDIGPSSGSISTTSPGMCPADVSTCVTDIVAISGTSLTNASLTDLASALSRIPDNLKNSNAAVANSRIAVRDTVPTN